MQDSTVADNPPLLQRADEDVLAQMISTALKENTPKPVIGPAISEKLGSLVEVYVLRPDFTKVIKMAENYPRPQNVPSLTTPDLPRDMNKTIDQKVIKDDRRLKNDQTCTSASITSLGKALDITLETKHLDLLWRSFCSKT